MTVALRSKYKHFKRASLSPLAILDSRCKSLPGFSYKLGEVAQYGLDVFIPDTGLEVDENKMTVVIPYADGRRRDGVGDLLDVQGINTERHRLNPLILFDHGKVVPLPIGVAQDPQTKEYCNYVDAATRTAKLKAFWYQGKGLPGLDRTKEYDHAVFAAQLFDLVAKKFLRGGSIGYQVIDAEQIAPDYRRGIPQGLYLKSVLMLEGSLVVLPANMDTVGKMLCMGKCCGKTLSPYLVKSLQPYAPTKKAQLGYEAKSSIIPGVETRRYHNIPPSRWRPGLGASAKELRKKYKRQAMRPDEENYRSLETGPQKKSEFVGDTEFWKEEQRESEHKNLRSKYKKHQPSSDISPEKARQILHDDSAQGHPLTEKQRAMFGAAASRGKKDLLPGGLGDSTRPQDVDPAELARGIEVEMEHTKDRKVAEEIALDHLTEDPKYYTKLRKVEGKDLRSKYKKHQPSSDISPEKAEQILHDNSAHGHPLTEKQRAMFGAAASRKILKHEGGKWVLYSHQGRVLGRHDSKEDALKQERAIEANKHKNLGDYEAKGLDALRKKYRCLKGLRKRMKRSSPGSSVLCISGKDLDEIKGKCDEMGLDLRRIGTKGNLEKIRLTGDDKAIDLIAKQFARRW